MTNTTNLIVEFKPGSIVSNLLMFLACAGESNSRKCTELKNDVLVMPKTQIFQKLVHQKADTIKSVTESKLITCTACSGTGKYDCVAKMYNGDTGKYDPLPAVRMDCQVCKGVGEVDPVVLTARAEAFEAFWCSCGNPSQSSSYVDDNTPDAACSKHHYTCNDCGKVTQTG